MPRSRACSACGPYSWRGTSPQAAKQRGVLRASLPFPDRPWRARAPSRLREAARRLDLEMLLPGGELEGSDFWSGVRVRRNLPADWMLQATAIVQPAFVEDKPRLLLAAIAAGVPVIATAACGLGEHDGATMSAEGDVEALVAAIAVYNRIASD